MNVAVSNADPLLFDDTPLFREVNAEAQKESATDAHAPCLTWHMAFLIGKNQRDTFKGKLDDIVHELVAALRADTARCLSNSIVTILPRSDDRTIFFTKVFADYENYASLAQAEVPYKKQHDK